MRASKVAITEGSASISARTTKTETYTTRQSITFTNWTDTNSGGNSFSVQGMTPGSGGSGLSGYIKFIGCISIGAGNYGFYGNNFPIASDSTLQVTMTDCTVINPCRAPNSFDHNYGGAGAVGVGGNGTTGWWDFGNVNVTCDNGNLKLPLLLRER